MNLFSYDSHWKKIKIRKLKLYIWKRQRCWRSKGCHFAKNPPTALSTQTLQTKVQRSQGAGTESAAWHSHDAWTTTCASFFKCISVPLRSQLKWAEQFNSSPFGQGSTQKNPHPEDNLTQSMGFFQRKLTMKSTWNQKGPFISQWIVEFQSRKGTLGLNMGSLENHWIKREYSKRIL